MFDENFFSIFSLIFKNFDMNEVRFLLLFTIYSSFWSIKLDHQKRKLKSIN